MEIRKMVSKKRHVRSGFTLLELMAVIVIIGLLAAVVGQNVMGKIEKAKVISTIASLDILHEAVGQFKFDTGHYPSEEDGLEALVIMPSDVTSWEPGGYLKTTTVPTDSWGNEFDYIVEPTESGKPYVVVSYGADGEEGGEDYDADLWSTDAR
jgi:general secretion pathway protein G